MKGLKLTKDPTTISKEIKKHRTFIQKSDFYHLDNLCVHAPDCKERHLCNYPNACKKLCKNCSKNVPLFPRYEIRTCKILQRSPRVCNPCQKKQGCRFDRYFYRAAQAHSQYRTLLSSSREGINSSANELAQLDELVSPRIRKGRSIAHIYATNKALIPCTSRTLYNYVDLDILTVKNLDLPRNVKYKPRKKLSQPKRNPSWREGRRYSDFCSFTDNGSMSGIVEMDTVIGSGSKVLLTLYFRDQHFMLAYLLPNNEQKSVINALNHIENTIGSCEFFRLFHAVLTNNGTEFSNPNLIELGNVGLKRCSVFYCDPRASWQKLGIEKNHEFIRYILPKGRSFYLCFVELSISLSIPTF